MFLQLQKKEVLAMKMLKSEDLDKLQQIKTYLVQSLILQIVADLPQSTE